MSYRARNLEDPAEMAGTIWPLGTFTRSFGSTNIMNRPRVTILFDVEGTLMDCVPQTLESWRLALSEFEHSFRRDELQPYSGMDGGEMLECLLPALPKGTREQILKRQGELYRERYLRVVHPFAGVREVFDKLKRMGLTLAIATTCKHDELVVYDEHMQVLELTDAVVCGDDVDHGKPHPDLFQAVLRALEVNDPSQVTAIGDTPYDAKAAIALGLKSVGLLAGGFSRAALLEAGCASVLEQVHGLPPYLESSIGRTTEPVGV